MNDREGENDKYHILCIDHLIPLSMNNTQTEQHT